MLHVLCNTDSLHITCLVYSQGSTGQCADKPKKLQVSHGDAISILDRTIHCVGLRTFSIPPAGRYMLIYTPLLITPTAIDLLMGSSMPEPRRQWLISH